MIKKDRMKNKNENQELKYMEYSGKTMEASNKKYWIKTTKVVDTLTNTDTFKITNIIQAWIEKIEILHN